MSQISVYLASMLDWLVDYDGPLFDACVTDPPYHLTSIVKRFGKEGSAECKVPDNGTGAYARASRGFMGKEWDGGDIAQRPETWRRVYDALKPGAHLVAFAGTRTYHRMTCAIEDAGFEIRDMVLWHYGSGFPKSHNVANSIDKANGCTNRGHRIARASAYHPDGTKEPSGDHLPRYAARTPDGEAWEGWGTALKPATEPICLARKPLDGTVAANVLKHGTGALHIDGCRVAVTGADERDVGRQIKRSQRIDIDGYGMNRVSSEEGICVVRPDGRWPSNLVHDGSEEVLAAFPDAPGQLATVRPDSGSGDKTGAILGKFAANSDCEPRGDSGSAARFFYSAKAGPLDRIGTAHATVKPVDLMRWLCRLVTPPGGLILDPFAGSGTTGIAAMAEGFDCAMVELEADHAADIERKLAFLRGEGGVGLIERHKARIDRAASTKADDGPLFGGAQA